jgi:hypothetical protein
VQLSASQERLCTLELLYNYIVTRKGGCVTYKGILDCMIGFIATLCTPLAILHTLQFAVTPTIGLHELYPCNGSITVPLSVQYIMKYFLLFLLNSLLQLPTPEVDSILILAARNSSYIASGRPPQKTPLPLLLRVDSLLQKYAYLIVASQSARSGPQKAPLFYC